MPRAKRPAESGYARIAQAEEEQEEQEEQQQYSDHDDPFHDSHSQTLAESWHGSTQPKRKDGMHMNNGTYTPQRPGRRKRTNSGVDIKAINARLERWAEEIKERFTLRRFRSRDVETQQLEIYSSVFQAPESIHPATKHTLETDYDDSHLRMSKLEFDDIVESVRTAIELGTHPTLISQGSSGSYFARNPSGKVMGVFKPKDEEPYASKNPKWTKWSESRARKYATNTNSQKFIETSFPLPLVVLVSYLISHMSRRLQRTFLTFSYEPTLFPTPTL